VADIVMGLDLGTGGVRAIAVDLQGQVIAQTTVNYPLLTPQPGWAEQHPADWIAASLKALTHVAQQLDEYRVGEYRAIAIGLSGQMHGLVPLDTAGSVIRPAILWNDQRTGAAVAEIEAKIPRLELIQRTGNPAITGFQLPKLLWLRSQEPQSYTQICRILLPKDYLGYYLTGNQVTEPSDASGIGCLNLASRNWDEDILKVLDLSADLLPTVIDSTAIAGYLKPDVAAQIGLPSGLPVVAGGGDNAAAAIGLGIASLPRSDVPTSGEGVSGSLSIGTSGVIFVPCDRPTPDPQGRVHLFCHVDGGYHLLGVTLSAGGALRWYRDTFAPHLAYTALMALAESSLPGAQGVLFLPHLSGERSPYLDPEARGAWVNLALAHAQADMVRSVLEGVAFSLRSALEVTATLAPVQRLLATGGGARSPLWLKILADILKTELVAPPAEEGAAYGAALLAMVGVKAYPTLDAVLHLLPQSRQAVQPQDQPIYEAGFQQYLRLYEALKAVR
jgi:xylulokinase